MCRSTFLAAIVTLALCAGCGESKPVRPPAPAYPSPSAQSPDQSAAADQPGASLIEHAAPGQPPSEPASSEEATPEEATSPKEADANEAAATPAEETPEEQKATQEKTVENPVPADEQGDKPQSTDEETGSKKPAGPAGNSSGKLLRGLGSSLSRALSKAASAESSGGEARPAPDLADDPFPGGEPAENDKPKEQAR